MGDECRRRPNVLHPRLPVRSIGWLLRLAPLRVIAGYT